MSDLEIQLWVWRFLSVFLFVVLATWRGRASTAEDECRRYKAWYGPCPTITPGELLPGEPELEELIR